MTTTIGYKMAGSGVRYHHAAGDGVIRHVASAAVSHLGHKLVDTIAHKIRGGDGYKLTGCKKKHPGRPRKPGRPKKTATRRKKHY